MRFEDLSRLRQGRGECPSDLVLDRYGAGELPVPRAEALRAHLGTCEACAAHLRRNAFPATPEVRAQAMLAGVRAGLDRRPSPRERARRLLAPLLRPRGQALALLGAACAAALLLLPRPAPLPLPTGDTPEQLREKGGALLHVHILSEGGSREVLSGDRLPPGARLRFVVDLPTAGHVSVVGAEADGRLFPVWPIGAGAETLRSGGPGQVLPGAVALDEARGKESFYLVHCPPPAGPPRCRGAGRGAAPACQRGCALSRFVIDKGP